MALALVAACSELGGTALNVAYDHADWLAEHKIARYVDLDKSQKAALQAHFDRLHAWHRAHELPVYADLLDQAAERMARPLQIEDIAWMMREVDERRRIGAAQLANELAPVLITLSMKQRLQLADNLVRDQARFTKTHLVPDRSKMLKERTEWLVGQVERWIGNLTPAQRTRVNAVAVATPDYPGARVAERRRRQLRFVQLVDQFHDEQAMRPPLMALLAVPRTGADQSYRAAIARYERELTQMVLDLDRTLTARQRALAVSRLHQYAVQARALAAKRT